MVLLCLSCSGLTKRGMPASLGFNICFLPQLSHHHHPCRAQAQQRHRAEHLRLPQAGCFLPAKARTGSHLLIATVSASVPASSTAGAVRSSRASQPCSPNGWEKPLPLGIAKAREDPTQYMRRVHLLRTEITFSCVFCYL